jgi:hypothetical protein
MGADLLPTGSRLPGGSVNLIRTVADVEAGAPGDLDDLRIERLAADTIRRTGGSGGRS